MGHRRRALGITAVLAASAALFSALKIASAVYLVVLGLQSLFGARTQSLAVGARSALWLAPRAAIRQGVLTNLLNPKAALFLTALLPQFVSTADDVLAVSALMTAIASLASPTGLAVHACLASAGRRALARPRVARRLDQLSGAVLVALGVRIALERR